MSEKLQQKNLQESPSNGLLGDIPIPEEVKNASEDIAEHSTGMNAGLSKLHLFFSFDIVNSTMYKTMAASWPLVIKSLLDDIRKRVSGSEFLYGTSLWRVIGDEMVFVLPISTEAQLLEAVDAIYEITQKISASLRNGKFFDTLIDQSLQTKEINMLKSQGALSIKAASWIAAINNGLTSSYDNISFHYSASEQNQTIREFLGKDIDTGFRLKGYTQDRRLIISVELACLLLFEKQENLHILDYTRLKGVWNDNLYPIIWYYDEKIVGRYNGSGKRVSFVDSFRYDESENNPLVSRFLKRAGCLQISGDSSNYNLANEMYDVQHALPKIVEDRNLQAKLDYMRSLFVENTVYISRIALLPLELHCAVVCCDVKNKRILIAKRNTERKANPGKWEFGCARAESGVCLVNSIKEQYKRAFGMDINLVLDETREERQPKPVAVYEISEQSKNKKGIIFVASVDTPFSPDQFRAEGEHEEIRWISETDLQEFSERDSVQDFINTAKTVFKNFSEYFKTQENYDI